MKVYLVFEGRDRHGQEVFDVEKVFATEEAAVEYVDSNMLDGFTSVERNPDGTLYWVDYGMDVTTVAFVEAFEVES